MYPYGTTEGKWPSSRHYHTREPSCSDFVFTSIDDDPTRFGTLLLTPLIINRLFFPFFAFEPKTSVATAMAMHFFRSLFLYFTY